MGIYQRSFCRQPIFSNSPPHSPVLASGNLRLILVFHRSLHHFIPILSKFARSPPRSRTPKGITGTFPGAFLEQRSDLYEMASRGASAMLSRAARIKQKLQSALEANAVELRDLSHRHANHVDVKDYVGETHYNLKVVSAKFEGQSLLKRHQMVHELLADELESGLHALSIMAKTPKEAGLG